MGRIDEHFIKNSNEIPLICVKVMSPGGILPVVFQLPKNDGICNFKPV